MLHTLVSRWWISHQRLLSKLDFYGIRGTTLSWIKAFLSDRSQQVIVDGVTSERAPVVIGVPKMIRSCWIPLSSDLASSCVKVKSCVSQLLLARKPCWQSVSMVFWSRCFKILLVRRRSCETQLLTLTHELAKSLDSGIQQDLIILDFSKAFDKVPHQRLLSKLDFYGIRQDITRQYVFLYLTA
jgi:hypothetical protein